jgi:hypothetical protein
MTKKLHLDYMHFALERNDFTALKTSFKSNQGLEELHISKFGLAIQSPEETMSLFHAIAAAPKLHTVFLQFQTTLSAHQRSTMFLRALQECGNSALENIKLPPHGSFWNTIVLKEQLLPFLEFNRDRRLFLKGASSIAEADQLLHALTVAADTKRSLDLRFWLVRKHAGDLGLGNHGEQA